MKRYWCVPEVLVLLVLSSGCQRQDIAGFIPGTYVNHAAGAFSSADDTLVVSRTDGLNYRVLRKTGFNRLRSGKPGKREYEREKWHAVFDAGPGVLRELRYGKIIRFFPDSGFLRVGERVYDKIK